MNIKVIEKRIIVLKEAQSAIFKKKKLERDIEELSEIRLELNDLKQQARSYYRKKNSSKIDKIEP